MTYNNANNNLGRASDRGETLGRGARFALLPSMLTCRDASRDSGRIALAAAWARLETVGRRWSA